MSETHGKYGETSPICAACGADMVCSEHGFMPCDMCEAEGLTSSSLICSRCGKTEVREVSEAERLDLLEKEANPQTAKFKALLKVAEGGDVAAKFAVAMMYRNGEGVSQSETRAVKWFRAAAEEGHPEAQFFMAQTYLQGDVVRKNAPEALKWYRKAASKGILAAKYELAMLLYEGSGSVKQDLSEAVRWMTEAARAGFSEAQYQLALRGDLETAKLWFQKAADQGHRGAKNELAKLRLKEDEVKKHEDIKKADVKKPDITAGLVPGWLVWVNVGFVFSFIAGFSIGAKFWSTSLVIAAILFLRFGKKLSSLADRFFAAIVGGITLSGLMFAVLWGANILLTSFNLERSDGSEIKGVETSSPPDTKQKLSIGAASQPNAEPLAMDEWVKQRDMMIERESQKPTLDVPVEQYHAPVTNSGSTAAYRYTPAVTPESTADRSDRSASHSQGWLGVAVQQKTLESAPSTDFNVILKSGGFGGRMVVLITGIAPGSPADLAGMEVGDWLISVDNKAANTVESLQAVVSNIPAGRVVPVQIIRDGNSKYLLVTIAQRP